MKILVVEDEPAIARIIRLGLQRNGHEIDVLDNGREAQEKIVGSIYDVIILDVMLPGADGFEICRRVRDLGLDSKIIILTARSEIDCRIDAFNAGADEYMVKPFSIIELEKRIIALMCNNSGGFLMERLRGENLI